ncbi:MAG: hypothetical protein LBI42_06885 [Chitinispirillales bacterium]|jgi:hypothetical protein|nr:hypothetical protein [Chitinispirillales bacterium]
MSVFCNENIPPAGQVRSDIVLYKYHLDPDCNEGEIEAGKANPDNTMRMDYPENYVEAIKTVLNEENVILIPPDLSVLRLLRKDKIPYTLCYPKRDAKEIYRKRFINRGNTENFIDIFIGCWDNFFDSLEKDTHGKHVVMRPHKFLSDILGEI